MKCIGILGGISHHTTLEYYKRIMELYSLKKSDLYYPEIVIYSLSHGQFKIYEDSNDIDNYLNYISFGVERLMESGADFVAMAANSPHRVIDHLRNRFDISFVSALDSAFEAAERQHIKKGLLLGIKFTMQSDFYQKRFAQGGIELITPTIDEQEVINHIIFNRLNIGKELDQESKDTILEIISHYEVDGVILGCMRLPVYFNETTVKGINLVNALQKHVEDILYHCEN